MNVLKYFPYRWRHYITHPWEFFEDCWLNVKAAYQRVTRGFAYRDLFSVDSWFLDIFPEMLKEFRENLHSFPGDSEFPTFESWTAYLEEMETHFRNANENQKVQLNEWEEDYLKYPMEWQKNKGEVCFTMVDNTPKDITEKWLAREMEINAWREEELKKAMEMLMNCFHCLWN